MNEMSFVKLWAVIIDATTEPIPIVGLIIKLSARPDRNFSVHMARDESSIIKMVLHVCVLMQPKVSIRVVIIIKSSILHVEK